jgi:serine/threonine protein kinase
VKIELRNIGNCSLRCGLRSSVLERTLRPQFAAFFFLPMAIVQESAGKFAGTALKLPGAGRVELTQLLHQNSETSIYASTQPNMVIKIFDLDCGKADEVSYGPYVGYKVELENWEDVQRIEELRVRVPAYYGSGIDYERKFAYIAMEFLQGQDLISWCRAAGENGFPEEWVSEFRAVLFETFTIVDLFHKHGIVLIDFKPDNVIRLDSGIIRFVDMGAFYTPRHTAETENYVYSATPDYAELVIDSSNVQTGQPLKQGADIFAAGVALFEMATGGSRLGIANDCAEQMLSIPGVYLFRDSQIKDVWHDFPHLKPLFPLIATQLRERQILFSEFWHLLKGFLANQMPNWETLTEEQHAEALLATGKDFISDQLPDALKWLAESIAEATTLRKYRLPGIAKIVERLAAPIAEAVREDIFAHNAVIKMGPDLYPPVAFEDSFNTWEARLNPASGHWALSTRRLAVRELRFAAAITFLKLMNRDEQGHRFYEVVADSEADYVSDERLTLEKLVTETTAWVGA